MRNHLLSRAALALFLLAPSAGFAAGNVELLYQTGPGAPQISQTASGGDFLDGFSGPDPLSVSADGRYAVFLSSASNLVPGQRDLNGVSGYPGTDVFLADLSTGALTLVSHAMGLPSTTGNQGSSVALLSGDGRWVLFRSAATDLVPGQHDTFPPGRDEDLLLYDRVSGATTLVAATRQEDAYLARMAISADGRFITYDSDAGDLIPGAHPGPYGAVYLYDRTDGSTRLVSHLPNLPSEGPSEGASSPRISADGRYVVFLSASADLLPGQISGRSAILYDRVTGALSPVGPADSAEISADGKVVAFTKDNELRLYAAGATVLVTSLAEPFSFSSNPQRAYTLSADGRYLAFLLLDQVFGVVHPMPMVYDRIARAATPVARASSAPPGIAGVPRISADGQRVVFDSGDSGWIAGQSGAAGGIYLFELGARKTSLLSHTPGSLTANGNGASFAPSISADGSRAVYYSPAADLVSGLVDLNGRPDLFACDVAPRSNRAVTLRAPDLPSLTPVADGRASAISADGRWVAFERATGSLDVYQGQVDILLYDTTAKTTLLVNHVPTSATTAAKGSSFAPVLSADGRWVAFYSDARNLVPGVNASGLQSLFLFDRATGSITYVARTGFPYGARDAFALPRPSISADGRWLAFVSDAQNVVPGQQESDPYSDTHDVFLYDRDSRAITLVSHAASGATVAGNRASYSPLLSADGRWLVLTSGALDLLPGLSEDFDHGPGAYLYDRMSGALSLLTHRRSDPKTVSTLYSQVQMSTDGRYIAFATAAGDLDPNVPDVGTSIYIYDRAAGTYQKVISAGPYSGVRMAFSADGRTLAYPAFDGLTFYDRATRAFTKAPGVILDDFETFAISGDGRYTLFTSSLTSLVPGLIRLPGWEDFDYFRYDRVTNTSVLVNQWRGSAVTTLGHASAPLMSADGQRIAFTSEVDLVAGDYNRQQDAYLFSADGAGSSGPVTVPPCILFDTRRPADGPALRSNVARVVKAGGACGVPATAKRVMVKVTAFQGTGKGNLRFYPGDLSAPSSGILRFSRGQTVTSSFDLPLAPGGAGTLTLLPFVAGNGTAGASLEIDGYTP